MPNIPSGNGYPSSFRQIDLAAIVRQQWGAEFYRPDTGYQFSDGRRFDTSDQGKSGVYGIEVRGRILLEPLGLPDLVQDGLLQEDGFALFQES